MKKKIWIALLAVLMLIGMVASMSTVLAAETSDPKNTENAAEPEQGYLSTLLAQNTFRGIFDAINADTDAALAMTAEDVLALEAHVNALSTPETEDETAARTEVLDMVAVLKANAGTVECTCGTETEAHDPACPKFVPAEEAATYGGTEDNPATVTGTSGNATWTAGYYKVPENTTVTISGYVTVQGDVTLILGDGCHLYVNKGIRVTMSNNASLTINGEAKDESKMGKLTATGGDEKNLEDMPIYIDGNNTAGSAGIGGFNSKSPDDRANGPITINGGYITATGANSGAGIGTTLFALSEADLRAGVNSKYLQGNAINGHITINGGVVIASSKWGGAGIGGGSCSPCVGVTIRNARVKATAGEGAGAAIGGGYGIAYEPFSMSNWSGGTITIENSYVEAYGGNLADRFCGAAIGDGYSVNSMGNGMAGPDKTAMFSTVSISKDSIIFSEAIRGDSQYVFDTVIAAQSKDVENSVVFENKDGEVYGDTNLNWDLEIPEDYTLNLDGDSALTVPEGVELNNKGEISGGGALVVDGTLQENGETIINNGEYVEGATVGAADNVHIVVNVYYMSEDGYLGASGTEKVGPQHAVLLRESMIMPNALGAYYLPHGQHGWYYVSGTVTIENRFYVEDSQGDKEAKTKIILGNDCHFTAKHGIAVHATDDEIESGNYVNSLVIYREYPEEGKETGILEAHGTHSGVDNATYDTAGIGGGAWLYDTANSGEILIYGGNITVSGAENAANIGSGAGGTAGTIVIKNAKVTSGDAGAAASIGAGSGGSITTIKIENSLVLATSDQTHNGIGDDVGEEGELIIKDSIIFTDKIGPKETTYDNSLLFLNEKASEDQAGTYGNYNGTLKDPDGTVTLALPLTIPSSATLTIKNGETLIFDPSTFDFTDVEFRNDGKIYRDWGSRFETDTAAFTKNDKVGDQFYEIINMVDGLDDTDIYGTYVEIFDGVHSEGKLYALSKTAVTVQMDDGSHLQITVIAEHENEHPKFDGTSQARTFVMPADPVKLIGVTVKFSLQVGEVYDGFTDGKEAISILKDRYFTVQYELGGYSHTSFEFSKDLPIGTKLILLDDSSVYSLKLNEAKGSFLLSDFVFMGDIFDVSTTSKKVLCVDFSEVEEALLNGETILTVQYKHESENVEINSVLSAKVNMSLGTVGISTAQGGMNTIKATADIAFGLADKPNALVVELLDKDGDLLNYPAGASVTIKKVADENGVAAEKIHDNRAMAPITEAGSYEILITGLPAGNYQLRVSLAEDAAQLYPMQEITVSATSTAVAVTDGKVAIKAEGDTRLLPSTGGTIVFDVEALNATEVNWVLQIKDGGFVYKNVGDPTLNDDLNDISVKIPANDTDSAQTYRVWFYCGEATDPTAVFPYNIIVSKAE